MVTQNAQAESIAGSDLQRFERSRIGGQIDGLSLEVVFTVEASQSRYWRVGAFTGYTTQGWKRPAGLEDPGTPIVNRTGSGGTTLTQRITPRRQMSVVPAAWAPTSVGSRLSGRTQVGETGGLVLDRAVGENETVVVESLVRSPDPATLRSAGTDYPEEINETYTALPSSVPDRVGTKTDEIVSDDATPYDAAVAIENYLEREKAYSLNVSRPDGTIADSFLFEMDSGYCQYFATTMVVMLREEGIPARYVTGFSSGQRGDDGSYVVREMNAHAWVEVYFPEEGWVRFDPTPSIPREELEEMALEETEDESENESKDEQSEDDQSEDELPPLSVDVTPDPVPGETVTVEVTADGAPVADAIVKFNDERVGTTNESGLVTARVPYVEELNVTATRSDDARSARGAPALGIGSRISGGGGGTGLSTLAAAPRPRPAALARGTDDEADLDPALSDASLSSAAPENRSNTTSYDLDTTMFLSTNATAIPGRTVVFNVTIDDVPVRKAEVVVGGRSIGRTNDTGQIPVQLPYQETVTLNISRGAIVANKTYPLESGLDVSLERPVAGRTVNLSAEIEGEPLTDAAVSVDGERVGQTDETGTSRVDVPYRQEITVTVARDGLETRRTVSVAGDLSTTVSGEVLPTGEVLVQSTLEGRPVVDAVLTLDGEEVGRTNASGEATVTVPFRKQSTLTVTRGKFTDSQALTVLKPVTLSVSGRPVPSETVDVTATVGDVPLPNATVTLDGESIGRTDESGEIAVTVPHQRNSTVRVSRGGMAGSRTLTVDELMTLSVSGVRLPTRPVTVTATVNDVPVHNATVLVNGDVAGTTGAAGEATLTLPLANTVDILVTRGEFSASKQLSGIVTRALALVLVLGLVAAAAVGTRRDFLDVPDDPTALGRALAARGLSALLLVSGLAARFVSGLAARLTELRRAVERFVHSFRNADTLRERVDVVVAALAAITARLESRLRLFLAAVRAVDVGRLLPSLDGIRRLRASPASPLAPGGSAITPGTAASGESFDVVVAWAWVERRTGVRDRRTRTPGEIAREAASRGWPRQPVETVLRAYRRVTYAERTLDAGRERTAQQAFERLRAHAEASTAPAASQPDETAESEGTDGGGTGGSEGPSGGEVGRTATDENDQP